MITEFDSKRIKTFESYVLCFAIVQILHLISLIANLNSPLGLLYGPLLFCMYSSVLSQQPNSLRRFLLQSFPFLLFFAWYLLTYLLPSAFYLSWILPIMVLSSLIYCVTLFFKMKRNFYGLNNEYVLLIKQLSGLGITISFFLFLFYIDQFTAIDLRIDALFTLSVSLFFCVLIAVQFLYLQWKGRKNKVQLLEVEAECAENPVLLAYGKELQQVMVQQELFLNPNLSLSDLSMLTAISKADISDYINLYAKCNYYEWLAKYRIEYAMSLMESSAHQLKMEAVAAESGFNSKTVFYRYFKLFVGESPAVYRAKLIGS